MSDSHFNLDDEVFKPIPDFPGYDVSNRGRVRSYRARGGGHHSGTQWSTSVRPQIYLADTPQRFLKPVLRLGYPVVTLFNERRHSPVGVHRLILLAFVGPCPPGMECRHLDGVRTHCFLENLAWGTRSKNALDRVEHGNDPNKKGIDHPQTKLTDEQVLEIRDLATQGKFSQREIGKMFNLTQSAVSLIVCRKNWSHLP